MGTIVVAQQVKTVHATPTSHIGATVPVPVTPFCIHFMTNVLGQAVNDGPSANTPVTYGRPIQGSQPLPLAGPTLVIVAIIGVASGSQSYLRPYQYLQLSVFLMNKVIYLYKIFLYKFLCKDYRHTLKNTTMNKTEKSSGLTQCII